MQHNNNNTTGRKKELTTSTTTTTTTKLSKITLAITTGRTVNNNQPCPVFSLQPTGDHYLGKLSAAG